MRNRGRRLFLFMLLFACATVNAGESSKRILLRSSWQTVNIGDIAHTPGMLALLEKHLPDAEITLWPNKLSDDVVAMLKKRFPKLRFAMTAETQKAALAECEFCLHGSGPGLVGAKTLTSWQATGKPYGFGGVTLSDAELKDHQALLAGAKFVFCRDTKSLEALQASGITGPPMAFGPDATFLLDLRDDAKADAFLREHKLEPKKFACFVPRLRWTPYWKEGRKYAPEELARKDAENQKFQEVDHAKLRTAIIAWVRETKLPVLLCPEMTYQVELLRPLLFDPLPEDVKPHVIVRPSYWLTDEAASTYARAAVVVSFEMHSPIIAIANGTPAIHLRQPTDTRKGQMWRDVGLSDWLFEIDETTGEQIAAKLLTLHRDSQGTAARVAKAREFTAARGRQMIESIVARTPTSERPDVGVRSTNSTDPLAAWRSGVKVRPVSADAKGHTIHSYFNTCPESPDGKWVLFFASATADSHLGEVRIRDRATGEEKVLARNISVEDAHRVACQQWVSKGRRVVFHGERDREWFVSAVDLETGSERVLAKGRLAGWGQSHADVVPLYGPHWDPGPHRDLELLNVETGEIRTAVTNADVKAKFPGWLAKAYGDKPTSIFFPVLSPDMSRVFFKMASPSGGDARSSSASQRQGLVCYSLANEKFLFLRERWGHPAWHPDQKTIVEMAYTLIDSDTGQERRLPGLPAVRGDHPSASPDGKLIVTDTTMDKFGGDAKEWGIVVANATGGEHVLIHRFDNSRGAASWRRSHPHPVFSPDGRRIYFNVSDGQWTRLFVAERSEP